MQRVWVVVLSVWAMLAIVAVLAWSSRPPAPLPAAAAQTVVVKGHGGKQRAGRPEGGDACDDCDIGGGARMSTLHRTEWRAVGTNCAAAVTAGQRTSARCRGRSPPRRRRSPPANANSPASISASDLSRLNAAGGRWTPVGRRLLEALGLALRAREDTGGRFDPTVLPALAAAGYDRSFELLEERQAAEVADGWRAGRRSSSTNAERPGEARAGYRRGSRRHRQGLRGRPRARRDARLPHLGWSAASSTSAATSLSGASLRKAARGWSRSPIRVAPGETLAVLALDQRRRRDLRARRPPLRPRPLAPPSDRPGNRRVGDRRTR